MCRDITVGVSGGVDSAVCVMMLKNAGYRVTGVMLGMYGNDEKAAAGLSIKLGIPVIYRDVADKFEEAVIRPFIEGLMSGATPSPCTICNPTVKWREIKAVAEETGSNMWATGHYCRITEHDGKRYVTRGIDPVKDQSYYLWRLDDELLSGASMPLGDSFKSDIKDFATRNGLGDIASERESMGVCFFGSDGYASLLRSRCHASGIGEGDVRDASGITVARHKGFPFYTVGQKRGLDIPAGMCVTNIDAATNTIYIGRPEELYTDSITLTDTSIRDAGEFFASDRMTVSVRGIGRNPDGFVKVRKEGDKIVVKMTGRGAWAACKGQPAVFYIDDRVVGGGIVCG
ncbi:MAG: tRNA-specific 2-thiouridylase [Rikenellaceae bacterium]|nr:tRNA-specific 2-thiouridylase [Rikenellaceae bacterium]